MAMWSFLRASSTGIADVQKKKKKPTHDLFARSIHSIISQVRNYEYLLVLLLLYEHLFILLLI